MKKPVQLWHLVWDQRYANCQYYCFEDQFVKPLMGLLGYDEDFSLSLEIKKFLRPKDFNPKLEIDHNGGDWHSFETHTQIRVYGFEGAPNVLPKTIPDIIAYLESIRQMHESNHLHLISRGKQSFLPSYLSFGDFVLKNTKSYELIGKKMKYFSLSPVDARVQFDLEGYIQKAINLQGLKHYEHVPLLKKDFIRNWERKEVSQKMELYNKVMSAYNWKLVRDMIKHEL